jgi:hypothetical protein
VTELGVTYRVYAQFENAGDQCIALYAVGTSELNPAGLNLGVSTSFYQHPQGADFGSEILDFFFGDFPDLVYDSWLTIGSETSNDGPLTQWD